MQVNLYNNRQYVIRFYWKDKEGKRRNISLTKKEWNNKAFNMRFFEKNIAPIEMAKRIQELEAEDTRESIRKNSVAQYAEDFLRFDETMSKSSTNGLKGRTMRKYIVPNFSGSIPVNEAVTTKTMTAFRIAISEATALCPATKNKVMSVMRQFLDYLISQKAIDGTEGCAMKAILVGFKEKEEVSGDSEEAVGNNFWTKEEYDRFMATFDHDDPYRFFFYISFWCGTRIGETLGLRFSDFDEKEGTLSVARQYSKERKLTTTKTTNSKAKINIPSHIFRNLKEYFALVKADDKDDFLFFPSIHGSRTTIQRKLDQHIDMAEGLKHITVHGFRHSCASNLLRNGFDYMDVCKYLRHSSPDITLRVYSHWIEKNGSKKISMMEE